MQKTISRRPVSSPKMTPRDVLSYFITQRYALLQEHPIHLSTDCMSQKILEILKSLATSTEARPPSARIKDFIVEIETAMAAGVKQETLLRVLGEQGIQISASAFRALLYRHRKKKKAAALGAQREVSQSATHLRAPEPQSANGQKPSPRSPRSDLSAEEKAILENLDPSQKIEFFRARYAQNKFTHNPTPERFRKDGD